MLTVKASARPSQIEGIGLFADELIPKGTIAWKFDPQFDRSFDPQQVAQMPELQQEFIKHFAYLSKISHQYILSIDDARFTNHAIKNNIDTRVTEGEREICGVANRDIGVGEELTVNYRLFDSHDETSSEEYLSK